MTASGQSGRSGGPTGSGRPAGLRLQSRATGIKVLGGAVLIVTTDWYCPNCGLTDQTREVRPHQRLHACPKMGGLSAPLLPVGTKAKVYAKEREDYIGREKVQLDENSRPIMSVVTVRDDGQDAIVFAPTATLRAEET